MLDYALKLTLTPAEVGEADVARLREVDFDDTAILDICQVVSYFNYVNRMADGLGVELEAGWREEDYTVTEAEFEELSRPQGLRLSDSTLDEVDRLIEDRRDDSPSVPDL